MIESREGTCPRGHDLSELGVYVRAGREKCVACERAGSKAWREQTDYGKHPKGRPTKCAKGHDLATTRAPSGGCAVCQAEQKSDYNRRRREDPAFREARRQYEAGRVAGLRQSALDHYGHRCACCGESEERFLQFDHVDGGGGAHRREVPAGRRFLAWLKREGYPCSIRLLCANCNWARGVYGSCPHEEER